ncbi:MAG TPA: acyl-CoA dehydrogenase [Vicinamibacteria bacterium]|nr:acyl-CoA dehydrogenase [Vicinamibacteria bacterium]
MTDPHLEDRHRELADRVRDLGERHLRAVGRDEENPSRRAAELGALLGDAGLLRHAVPPPVGAMDARGALVAREGLAYFSLLAEAVYAAQALAAHPVSAAGSEAQRGRWLPALAAGSVLGALALAEPEAGSDLGGVRTLAQKDGSLFRLSGVKTWVTAAKGAGLFVVLARASQTEGARGLSLFLVDGGAPGVAARAVETMAALPTCELRLDAAPAVLLGDEGGGQPLVVRAIGALRPGAAGAACGLAARALDEAVRHTLTRRQFGRPLAGFQATRLALADMHAELEAARRLARHAAWLLDSDAKDAPREAAAARLVAAETAGRVVDRAVQLHGAQGLVRGSTVERLYREARALRLREGTSEGLRLELAEAILRERR